MDSTTASNSLLLSSFPAADTEHPNQAVTRTPRRLLPPLTTLNHVALAVYWFPTTLTYVALSVILLPEAVAQLTEAGEKAQLLSALVSGGAGVQLLGPWFAALSDGWSRRRTPFMVVGTVLLIPGLALVAIGQRVWVCAAGYLIYQIFSTLAVQPYTATVADHVPPPERGRASGLVGLMQFLGSIAAAVLGLLYGAGTLGKIDLYMVVAGSNIVGAAITTSAILRRGDGDVAVQVTTAAVGPTHNHGKCTRQCGVLQSLRVVAAPFRRSPRFCWLFAVASASAASGGVCAMFVEYFIHDCLLAQRCDGRGGAPPGLGPIGDVLRTRSLSGAVAIFLLCNLTCSALATVAGGALADRQANDAEDEDDDCRHVDDHRCRHRDRGERGRIGAVLGCGLALAVAGNVGLVFAHSFTALVVAGSVLGLATGLVAAPAWALAVEVLPPTGEENASAMAIFFLNTLAPQLFVPLVCGQLLGSPVWHGRKASGYAAIFGVAGATALVALLCLHGMRQARDDDQQQQQHQQLQNDDDRRGGGAGGDFASTDGGGGRGGRRGSRSRLAA